MGAPIEAQTLFRYLSPRSEGEGAFFFLKCFLKVIFQNYAITSSPEKMRQHKLVLLIERYTQKENVLKKEYTETHLVVGYMKSLCHLLQKSLPHTQSLSYSLPFISPRVSWFTLETRNTSSQLPSLLVNNINRNREGMLSPPRLPTEHQLYWAPSHLKLLYYTSQQAR